MNNFAEEQPMTIEEGLAIIDEREDEHNQLLKRSRRAKIGGVLVAAATLAAAEALVKTAPAEQSYLFVRVYTDLLAVGAASIEALIGHAQSQERLEDAGSVGDETVQIAANLGIDAPSWAQQARRKRDEILAKTGAQPQTRSVK